jgi:hypothetical protein
MGVKLVNCLGLDELEDQRFADRMFLPKNNEIRRVYAKFRDAVEDKDKDTKTKIRRGKRGEEKRVERI